MRDRAKIGSHTIIRSSECTGDVTNLCLTAALSFLAKAIAYTGRAFDERSVTCLGVDLLPELPDENPEIGGILDVGRAPHGLKQLAVGYDLAGVLSEHAQELEFLGRQVNFGIANGNASANDIDRKITALSHRWLRAVILTTGGWPLRRRWWRNAVRIRASNSPTPNGLLT